MNNNRETICENNHFTSTLSEKLLYFVNVGMSGVKQRIQESKEIGSFLCNSDNVN